MFKKFIVLLLLLFVSTGLMVSVNADVGPKPTTVVEIIGFDESYYFDILFKVNESDVSVLTEDEIQEQIEYDYYRDDFPDELNGFQDGEGYASYTLYRDMPHNIDLLETNKFLLGYFAPPNQFKIVLVIETGEMIISNVVNTTLFNAEVTFDLSDFSLQEAESEVIDGIPVYQIDNPSPQESIPWGEIILQIIVAVVLTLVIEIFILFVFGYNQKSTYKLVIYVNLVTQFVFHTALIGMTLFASFFGFVFIFIVGELIVLTIEIIIYRIYLKEKSKTMATLYAIFANIISLIFGTLLLTYIMGILI
ncbi:MAG: hypothetical protein PF513_03260 [Tenericutes bacterium]|jgi:hypothetical protein|nr:hypothetical protein [Mycoplasmatota bacterium]